MEANCQDVILCLCVRVHYGIGWQQVHYGKAFCFKVNSYVGLMPHDRVKPSWFLTGLLVGQRNRTHHVQIGNKGSQQLRKKAFCSTPSVYYRPGLCPALCRVYRQPVTWSRPSGWRIDGEYLLVIEWVTTLKTMIQDKVAGRPEGNVPSEEWASFSSSRRSDPQRNDSEQTVCLFNLRDFGSATLCSTPTNSVADVCHKWQSVVLLTVSLEP